MYALVFVHTRGGRGGEGTQVSEVIGRNSMRSLSAAAVCPPSGPRAGAGRHVCDAAATNTHWSVSEADREESF